MNCCNDAGECTGAHGCAIHTTRVNTRADAPPTGIHFAPGAIERHTRPRSALTRSLRQLGAAIVLCAAAAGGGLLAAAVIRVIEGA
jgi:hypothetical protein